MLIHNDLFSVVFGIYSIISTPKKGTKKVSYKIRNSHTHYFCPQLSAMFIRTPLLGAIKQHTVLKAIKAGNRLKKHIRYWIPAFKLSEFSFWKKGMHLCVLTLQVKWVSLQMGTLLFYNPQWILPRQAIFDWYRYKHSIVVGVDLQGGESGWWACKVP